MYPAPDSQPDEERIGPIAGIEIIHELSPGIRLSAPESVWPDEAPFDDPIAISHAVGDVAVGGMRHVMDIGMRVSYYTPPGGGTAIRIKNLDPAGPVHVIRVVEPGRRYAVDYEFVPEGPAYRRDVEIATFAHAVTIRGTRLMAHGCGIVLANGAGAICLGTSGVGKSTLARMLDKRGDVRLLNDDRLVIEHGSGAFRLWATPWPGNGGVAREGGAELGVIALIARDRVRSARLLTVRESLPRLLPTLALPIWDRELMAPSIDLVDALLARVPVVELRYPLETATPDWIVETLQNIGR